MWVSHAGCRYEAVEREETVVRKYHIFLFPGQGGGEAGEGFGEDGAGTAYVEAHEALAAGAEHLAVVECQACLVDKKVDECVVVKTE